MNKKKVILLSIVVVLLAIIFVLFIVFKYKKIEIEGDYTGYQLILTVKYGGSGIAGQDLGSGTEKKNIQYFREWYILWAYVRWNVVIECWYRVWGDWKY